MSQLRITMCVGALMLPIAGSTFAAEDAAWEEYFRLAEEKRPSAIQERLESIQKTQVQLRAARGEERKQYALQLKTLRKELAGLKNGTILPPVVIGLKLTQGAIGVLNAPGIEVEIVQVIDAKRALAKVYGHDFMLEAETKNLTDGKRLDLSNDIMEVSGKTTFAPVLGADQMIPVVKVIPPAEAQRRWRQFLRQRKASP